MTVFNMIGGDCRDDLLKMTNYNQAHKRTHTLRITFCYLFSLLKEDQEGALLGHSVIIFLHLIHLLFFTCHNNSRRMRFCNLTVQPVVHPTIENPSESFTTEIRLRIEKFPHLQYSRVLFQ